MIINPNCTNQEFILRRLHFTGASTKNQLLTSSIEGNRNMSTSNVDKILNYLQGLTIISSYSALGANTSLKTTPVYWTTSIRWDSYISESRKNDLMGLDKLSKLIEVSINTKYNNPDILVRYNGNLYQTIEIEKIDTDNSKSSTTPNTKLKLQLLDIEEENRFRYGHVHNLTD
jgi:hypothetical protein